MSRRVARAPRPSLTFSTAKITYAVETDPVCTSVALVKQGWRCSCGSSCVRATSIKSYDPETSRTRGVAACIGCDTVVGELESVGDFDLFRFVSGEQSEAAS